MLRARARLLHRLAYVSDVVLSALLFVGLLSLEQMDRSTPAITRPETWRLVVLGLAAVLAWPLIVEQLGLYASQRRKALLDIAARLGLAALLSTSIVTIAAFLTAAPVARRFPVVFGLCQLIALGLVRFPVFSALRSLRRRGRNYRDVLVVGTGPRALRVRQAIDDHPEWGMRITAYLDDSGSAVDPRLAHERIHKFVEIPRILQEEVIDELILSCPLSMLPTLGPVVAACAEVGIPATLLSDLFGDDLPAPRVQRLGSLSALSFAPVHHDPLELAIKRGIDLVGASVGLLLALPVLAVAAVAIRTGSPGPILFRQIRCALHGRRFECIKLRSMYVDAEDRKRELLALNEMDGPVFKIEHDPRVTPAGRWLRRWSIDELPQLWNVLRGDMSLVGPRPPLPEEVGQYAGFERRRLSMRPGITCLWQVSGRNQIGFDEWVKLDLEYIDGWSLGRDLAILIRTIPAVLSRRGAR